MRLLVAVSSLALLTAGPAALASEPAAPATAAAPKAKKICRIKAAPTGSNRRDGRICKTEAEWRIYDGQEADVSAMTGSAQARSSSSSDD